MIQSVLLCGVAIWTDAPSKEVYHSRPAQVQWRRALQADFSTTLIAWVTPAALFANEPPTDYRSYSKKNSDGVSFPSAFKTAISAASSTGYESLHSCPTLWLHSGRRRSFTFRCCSKPRHFLHLCLWHWVKRPSKQLSHSMVGFTISTYKILE